MLLLVDSDVRSMRMLEVSLRKAGYDVEMARDGEEALAVMERRVPDLILSDTRLQTPATVTSPLVPRDGYDLCERLKSNEQWARVPFVFLTGSGDLNDKIRGLRLGVEDYLTKPIYLKELLTRVQLVLARRRRESMATTTRASFSGELGGMGLVDLLTTVDLGRKTGVIEIEASGERGSLIFRDGQVIDAATGVLRGERAVYRMLRWNDGSFVARFGPHTLEGMAVTPTISMTIQGLMLEGLRRADEWNHLEASLAPLDAPWEIDREALARSMDSLDPLATSLAERIDGQTTLTALLETCNDDLAVLTAVATLRGRGILRRIGATEQETSKARPILPPQFSEDSFDTLFVETSPTVEGGRDLDPLVTTGSTAASPGSQEIVPVSPTDGTVPANSQPLVEAKVAVRPAHDPPSRPKPQEHHVAKHKGKRHKGKHDAAHPRATPPTAVSAVASSAVSSRGPTTTPPSAVTVSLKAPADDAVRVEGNVIHLPVPAAETPAQTNEGSGAHPTPREPLPSEADVSALREAHGERERSTEPPAAPPEPQGATPDENPAQKPEAGSFFEASREAPAQPVAPVEAEPVHDASQRTVAPLGQTQPLSPPREEKAPDAKSSEASSPEEKKEDKKPIGRKDVMARDRKESLSTHLSEEARAFFSEQAYQAAYKTVHDTFEDLVPATEEHAREVARTRLWMKISGAVVVAIILASVGFVTWHRRYAVPETTLLASRPPQVLTPPESQIPQTDPTPAAEAQPVPEPEAPSTAPSPSPTPSEPSLEAPPSPTPEAPPASSTSATVPEAPPAPSAPSTAPTATVPSPEPTASPSSPSPGTAPTQTPQQLLAAARSFRGPLAGRIAAYEAYFNAVPTDFRTMTSFAMSLAESGRNADAERIAARAVAVNPNNAQGWFILAFTRKALRDTAGAAEARTRCIALGGQWAAECRAL
jgi:DNA-binding response OmpR family regulator